MTYNSMNMKSAILKYLWQVKIVNRSIKNK